MPITSDTTLTKMKKILLRITTLILIAYVAICVLLFFFQEKLLFVPEKLDKDFQFMFNQPFDEIGIETPDHVLLNGLLFKSDLSKGLVFYLHGNAGSLNSWGVVAKTYTDLNYDVFILDYRGFGKSEGRISSQAQLYQDIQTAYDKLKAKYDESNTIVLGYSIGTGLATYIASKNSPKLLILQAPYYSMTDMMRHTYPIIPTLILKYKFETNVLIKECKMPIVIFHGNQDKVIYYNSSVKLKEVLKKTDTLITLNGQGHNRITYNPEYITEIKRLLTK